MSEKIISVEFPEFEFSFLWGLFQVLEKSPNINQLFDKHEQIRETITIINGILESHSEQVFTVKEIESFRETFNLIYPKIRF